METKAAGSSQELIINSAFLFAGGYVRALIDSDASVSHSQLTTLKDLLGRVEEGSKLIAQTMRMAIEKAQVRGTDEKLSVLLLRIREMLENLRLFHELRPQILRGSPGLAEYWTEEQQRAIDRNLEVIEEAEETLALGLNPSFISEIDEARNEAGVKIDGEKPLPTR